MLQRVLRIAVSVALGSEILVQKGTKQATRIGNGTAMWIPSIVVETTLVPTVPTQRRSSGALSQRGAVSLRGCPPGAWSDLPHHELWSSGGKHLGWGNRCRRRDPPRHLSFPAS